MPYTGTGSGVYNSDLAFKDNLVFAGTYEGFRVIDVTNKSEPDADPELHGLQRRPGRRRRLRATSSIRSWDAEAGRKRDARRAPASSSATGFEGIHIFDITDPTNPMMIKQLARLRTGNEARRRVSGCGSHTATAVPDPARGDLYIYNGGSSGTCNGIDIVQHQASPTRPTHVHQARRRTAAPATPATTTTCC